MADELRFDEAPAAAPEAPTCVVCGAAVRDRYYLAGDKVLCATCKAKVEAELAAGTSAGGFARGLLYGLGGAAVGSALYYAILATTGYEIGLVAIVVGWLVGKAVFIGSGRRGGRVFQVGAVVLTYFAIVTTYIPLMFKAARAQGLLADSSGVSGPALAARDPAGVAMDTAGRMPAAIADSAGSTLLATDSGAAASGAAPATGEPVTLVKFLMACVMILGLAAALPVLAGLQNIIGMAIIAFALFEAWKLTGRPTVTFTGPFEVGPAAGGNAPPAPPAPAR